MRKLKVFDLLVIIAVVAGVIVLWLGSGPFSGRQRAIDPRSITPRGWLRHIASAEVDFRLNDRDGNHINDYWRADVAGLYATYPEGGTDASAIKLISLDLAWADDRPMTRLPAPSRRGPLAGYWYRALRYEGETEPDPQRYAVCAFPDNLSTGQEMYLVTELCRDPGPVMFRKPITNRIEPPERCPDEPEKAGWVPIMQGEWNRNR